MHAKTVSFVIFAVITCGMANAQATFEKTPQLPSSEAGDAVFAAPGSVNVTSAEAQLN